TISYPASPYCTTGFTDAVTRTGSAGGTYSVSPAGLAFDTNSGAIDPASSTAGNYTVTYSIAASGGCSAFSTTASVVITDSPSATIAYAGSPYCTSAGSVNVTRTGSTNGTYSATPSGLSINANSGAINAASSIPGTYTVTYSIAASGGCSAYSTTASIVITDSPSATIAYAGSPYCTSAGSVNVTRTGSSNGTYSSSPSGLSINANSGAINASSSTSGTYTVTYSIAASGACPAFTTTASVVITSAPSATIAYGSSPYCTSAGNVNVTRTGSTNGTYSSSPSGLSINANSGAINAASSTSGTYTVTYSIVASGGCSSFSTSASVVITDAPSATISYAGSPYCTTAGSVNVTRTGSTNGTYSSSPNGLSINANSGAINATNSASGTYTVTYSIAATGGCPVFSTTAQISIQAATTWYADADGDGVGDDAATVLACGQPTGYVAVGGDLCPNDPNKVSPGVCGCGMPDTDTDQDGLPDCIDSCPTFPGEVGDSCDDGDAGTENDVITEDCICEGTIITGVGQVAASNTDLVLYPNPNRTGTVHVELPGASVLGTVSIEVRDISGRIIHQTIVTPHGEQGRMTLDLPRNMGAGNYTVQVIANGQRYVQQLVMY
ncbi:MAG: T9SS type A sorting domain-containing protein, partial [Flavobacteriales bacterium]